MSTGGLAASRGRVTRRVCWVLLGCGLLAIGPLQRSIDRELDTTGKGGDLLYLPSGEILRQLSLGHAGLLANIYWTRVVQYFGRQRMAGATQFSLLGPLLRITTTLDPNLVIAYRFGAIFLAEKPPGGAGQPQQALALLRRGIVANPDYWRLWQDLGFVYYWDLKDYARAAQAFQTGSERPGALEWMRVLAATVAAKGGNTQTSRLLWLEIYRHADNDPIRKSALDHLAALQVQEEIGALNGLLARFREMQGRDARSFQDLVEARMLAAVPRDPSGVPYIVGPSGQTGLGPRSKIDLRLLQ